MMGWVRCRICLMSVAMFPKYDLVASRAHIPMNVVRESRDRKASSASLESFCFCRSELRVETVFGLTPHADRAGAAPPRGNSRLVGTNGRFACIPTGQQTAAIKRLKRRFILTSRYQSMVPMVDRGTATAKIQENTGRPSVEPL